MLKLFSLLLLSVFLLSASDKIEIYASSMQTQENIVKAYGEVSVVYKEYLLNADEAIYNRDSGLLELFGNIRAIHGEDYKILGDYAKLNIADKERLFQPFFMLDKRSNVWISADEGCAKDLELTIKSGIMSGCNPNNPLWKMEFSSSEYNTETKWLNLYNTRIYIYDIPVFYTPYFGYSLNTTRRTGILTPDIGASEKEGFYYEQSIYIAEENWWDLEFRPQIRTSRGYGAYSTFRFVDSKISKGEFVGGYFKDKIKYFLDEKLVNKFHYGYNFKYENSDLINQWFKTELEGQTALYIDVNNMNDVDYINLSISDTTKNLTSPQVLSRINLFNNTDKNYFGMYVKFYKDLLKESNEDTLQKLPTFQYHYYLDSLFKNHLLYNMDIQSNNIYRQINKRVVQTDIDVPITLQTSLFDEYLSVSYNAKFYAQHSGFNGKEELISLDEYNNGIFAREYNVFKLSSQLARAYENVTHVTGFGAKYTLGSSEFRNGFYEDNQEFCSELINQNDSRCDFYNITNIDEELQLDFSQYLYDTSGKQKFYHRLAQIIKYEDSQNKAGELENELEYQVNKSTSFYNNMFYNYDKGSFSKVFNRISYNDNGLNISLSHLYKDTFLDKNTTYTPYTSYVTSSARYTYDEHYSYFFKYDYDIEINLKKSAEIGFLYKKRCWDFGLKYAENNRPALIQNSESSSVFDRYVYFTITLKPLMNSDSSSGLSVKLSENLKGL